MTAPAVRTWADGYGRWHAIVPQSASDHHDARDAIVAELVEREGPNFDPSSIRVEMVEWTADTAHYVEMVDDGERTCKDCGESYNVEEIGENGGRCVSCEETSTCEHDPDGLHFVGCGCDR